MASARNMSAEPIAKSHFAENLPDQCPPSNATEPKAALLIRLAKTNTPTAACFASHAARNLPVRGDTSACQHASCSMFEHDAEDEQLNAMRALPRFRNFGFAFIVQVGAASGMALYGQKKHVDLWIFKGFDPVGAVTQVRTI